MYRTTLLLLLLSVNFAQAQTEIFNEDFQGGIPLTWSIVDNDGFTPDAAVSEYTDAWIAKLDPDNSVDTVASSTSYFDPVERADRWLITPAITLGSYGNFLYWEAKSHDASYPDGYHIYVSHTDNQISSFTDTVFTVSGELADWTSQEVNLSEEGYDDSTIYLAFVNRTYDGFKLYLDDIRVVIEDPVAVKELSPISFNVFPNPSNDKFTIAIDGFLYAELFELSGKRLTKTFVPSIEVNTYTSGTYLLQVTSETGAGNQLVVIE